MQMQKMRAVMYHYVRPGTENPPYEYYYLDIEDFRRQLDYFETRYELISRETFLNCITNARPLPDKAIVLTFDDGLIDHYEYVLPELSDRDLWGMFFIPGPLREDALAVHRVHTLLGTTPASEIETELRQLVDIDDVRPTQSAEFKRMYSASGSDEATTRVKRTLNYFLPYDKVSQVLDTLEERFPSAGVSSDELYMSPKQIAELTDHGMLVGGHTVHHRVLSRLDLGKQRAEINRCLKYVNNVVGHQSILSFAYPFGGAETFDMRTAEVLRNTDCDIAFTTEPGLISGSDIERNPLTLPRLDCNEFPHGTASGY